MQHPLGTDDLGRDVLSRLIWGARPTLAGTLVAMITACAIGIPWGLAAGYAGGVTDLVLMRIADSILVFPGVVLALALTTAFGPSLVSTMASLGIVVSPVLARVVRAGVLTVSYKDYVVVTRMYGLSSWHRVVRHVLPNVMAPTVVQITLLSGLAVLAQTGLNFLGLGVPNPNPSWGFVGCGDVSICSGGSDRADRTGAGDGVHRVGAISDRRRDLATCLILTDRKKSRALSARSPPRRRFW